LRGRERVLVLKNWTVTSDAVRAEQRNEIWVKSIKMEAFFGLFNADLKLPPIISTWGATIGSILNDHTR